jgi:3-oxoacyl-[acyl-carrier protein] reductase
MKDIEDFNVGDEANLKHCITLSDVERFVELTGDDNPLHVDPDYADNSAMKGIVTHGMLSASFLSTIIGKQLPGPGALWVSQSIEFLAPVRLNDELEVQAEITEIHIKQRLIKLKASISNQRGKKILKGECLVKLLPLVKDKEAPVEEPAQGCVIVTGASRGIGAAIATTLSEKNVPVIINCRDQESGERAVSQILEKGGRAHVVLADIRDKVQLEFLVEQSIAKYGTISGLVNNAAPRINEKDFWELSWEECSAQYDAQVGAAFNLIQILLPHMKAQKKGAIVNIGSIVNDQSPPANWIAYNMAKSGMHALTHNLAEVLGPDGIRINTVAPGLTDTAFVTEIPEKVRILTKMQSPLRRLANPEDIAKTVSFLLSDDAKHITGETLRANGGKTLL